MVFAENVLAIQTLSVDTGTVPPLQFEVVVHRLSPAVPVHCFVPPPQVTAAALEPKEIHTTNVRITHSFLMERPLPEPGGSTGSPSAILQADERGPRARILPAEWMGVKDSVSAYVQTSAAESCIR